MSERPHRRPLPAPRLRLRPDRLAARVRRTAARHPAAQWAVIGVLGVGTTATVWAEVDAARTARDAWGATTTVWIATRDVDEGEPVAARRRTVPLAVRPTTAATGPTGSTAVRSIAAGEIITDADVIAPVRASNVPDGWLIAPIVETVRSNAAPGDRVMVVSDGSVLARTGVVTEIHDDVTLVAVPADDAPELPRREGVALLLLP